MLNYIYLRNEITLPKISDSGCFNFSVLLISKIGKPWAYVIIPSDRLMTGRLKWVICPYIVNLTQTVVGTAYFMLEIVSIREHGSWTP